MSIDLEAARAEHHRGQMSFAGFNIYFLAHPPKEDMLKHYDLFGKGLISNHLEGAWISIRQFTNDPKKKDTKGEETFWTIDMKLFNDKHAIINKPMHDRCRVTFRRAIIRVVSE